jgi:hypothetical protein
MICYAGIGSREITEEEARKILLISSKLSKRFTVYSGNADGSDITFQRGSGGKCVIYLPWVDFNKNEYDPKHSIAYFDVGSTSIGQEYAKKYHPVYSKLSRGGKALMCRNTHQILGYKEFPRVSFVVYCATEIDSQPQGGTRQAVSIARDIGVPTFNIRNNEIEKLSNYLKELFMKEDVSLI